MADLYILVKISENVSADRDWLPTLYRFERAPNDWMVREQFKYNMPT